MVASIPSAAKQLFADISNFSMDLLKTTSTKPNNDSTRLLIHDTITEHLIKEVEINPDLRTIMVVCDKTNNPPDIVYDDNLFVEVYVGWENGINQSVEFNRKEVLEHSWR